MRSFKVTLGFIALATVLVASGSVHAHGIWFAERSTNLALIFGVGADDLDMVSRLPLVTETAAYDVLQQPVDTSLRATEYLVLADTTEHPAIVTAVFDNGVWSQNEDGHWERGGRDEVQDAVLSTTVLKYTVLLRSPLAEPLRPLPGQLLQIVPDDAILPDKMGADLNLRVLYKGQPAAGAEVMWDYVNDPDGERIVAGENGRVRIKVRNQGLNVIGAAYETTNDDKTIADRAQSMATLSFILPHEPE